MNKYKISAMCSLSIVIILIMSIIIPMKSNANEEEELELNMHYENSEVTAEISVNSDVYTGLVCKYLILDDILKSDDLVEQTKKSGTTVNIDKNESNLYTTKIPNVTKRYVVIYVSIGNCSICDYIDCQPSKQKEEPKEENAVNEEPSKEEPKKEEQPAKQEEPKKEEQQPAKQEEPKKEEQQPAKQEEPKREEQQPAKQEEPKKEEQQPAKQEEPKKEEQQPAKQEEPKKENQQPAKVEETNKNSSSTKETSSSKQPAPVINKETIDTTGFQEIEKSVSTTAVGNMPKTGEDDGIKILGIVIFSTIAVISLYKYKTTK